jgi:hypothetical protein
MQRFFDDCLFAGAIKMREALCGGRTEVFQMHVEADDDHEIKYLDVQSLYPYQLYSKKFPIGQPKVRILNKDVNWTSSLDVENAEKNFGM